MSPVLWSVTFTVIFTTVVTQQQTTKTELPPQDGFYNNLYQPEWGIAGSRLVRKGRADYSDGAYQMAGPDRPNPMDISQHVHSGQGGTQSDFGRNAMLVFYTQLVLDEILSTGQPGCPPEYENMAVPADHPLGNMTQRPVVYQRSAYDQRTGYSPNSPRQQTNGVTSYLDGGVIYGTSRMWTNHLRTFKDGALMADSAVVKTGFPYTNTKSLPVQNAPVPRDHSLKPVSRLFAIGNTKGHESPFLLALQVVWHRYHNALASTIKGTTPGLTDQQVFDQARKRVIATFQWVTFNEWLPAFLNGNNSQASNIPAYPITGYDPEVRPDVSHEFRTATNFRYSIMPAAVWTLGAGGVARRTPGKGPQNEARNVTSVRLCNQFWDSNGVVKSNLDDILRGMLLTLSEKEDEIVAPDLRSSYYGPYEYSRQDVVAMEIQRDRDHGVGDLNSVLQEYNEPPVTSWAGLGPRARDNLRPLYPNGTSLPDDVDLFTGAMTLQRTQQGQGIPDIFRKIIVQQFLKIRQGDRFWLENEKNGLFSAAELEQIKNTTFSDVLQQTTGLSGDDLTFTFTCANRGSLRCRAPPSLSSDADTAVDVCTPLQTYDYFSGSEVSFALSFLALFLVVPASIGVLVLLARRRQRHRHSKSAVKSRSYKQRNPNKHKAREWQGSQSGERNVTVEFDGKRKKVLVRDGRGKELRFIDLRNQGNVRLKTTGQSGTLMSLGVEGEVDLILRFEDGACCQDFVTALRSFIEGLGVTIQPQILTEAEMKGGSINRDERQTVLDHFFRLACLQAMAEDGDKASDLDPARVDEVVHVRLTRTEFAEALGMQPSSIFVRNIFLLADSDGDGFVSFHEFLRLFAVFLKGSAEEKARLMFNVYDVRRRGVLTRDDFTKMIKSLLEMSENANDLRDASAVTRVVDVMFREAGIQNKDAMTYEDFRKVFASKEYASTLQAATLSDQGAATKGAGKPRDIGQRKSRIINSYRKRQRPTVEMRTQPSSDDADTRRRKRQSRIRVSVHQPEAVPRATQRRYLYTFTKLVEVYYLQIFWVALYTLVTCGIFIERAYFYAAGREHAGLRRLSGAWTTAMIRGSASVIMFTYVSLLLTMCRNLITRMRETFLHRFVPFDSAVAFHKYIAVLAMLATIIHIVGHGTNLYCMCTQTTTNVNCFFREYFTPSTGFAYFHYWAFQTITGLAGVLVTVVIFIMYVFAHQWARRQVFTAFWFTHSLYPLVYFLTFLHGVGRLVQDPLFPWYLLGPLVIFVLDRLMSVSRNRIEIPVLLAELLPSDVIKLVFKRPSNFDYKSGQWVRIACLKLGGQEYHPFTLTSSPHERHLSLHIRAVGPWTSNLRQAYDSDVLGGDPYPKLFLDGPFGEGHQDWYSCDVAVLVGGGIGVTPFASILKDIAFKSRTGALITCQKVKRFGVFSCGPGPMTSSVQTACTALNRTEGYTYTHHYENF